MHCAVGRGRLEVAQFILTECPRATGWRDMNAKTPMHYAARNNRADAVRWLLFQDEDLAHDQDYKGRTPVDLCLENNVAHCDVAQVALPPCPRAPVPPCPGPS
jgi:ankyrin repeat protein